MIKEHGLSCFWCGKKCTKSNIDLHHLDGDRTNNVDINLALLCKKYGKYIPFNKGQYL